MFLLFNSPLFWYRLVFMAELLISEGMFTFSLKKRSGFLWRVILSIAAIYLIVFFFPIISFDAFYVSAMFIVFFGFTVAGLYICYKEPFVNIIFCAVAAYAVQHIAYELYTLLVVSLGLQQGTLSYGATAEEQYTVWTALAYVDSYAAVYVFMYFLMGRKIRAKSDLRLTGLALLVISGVILVVAVVLNSVVTYRVTEDTDIVLVCLIHGYNMLCCLLAVFMQFFMLREKSIKTELDTLQRLHKQEQQHYMVFKENVDYINIKCHDLKHQIRRIALKGDINDRVISELENAVNIYDSEVKSGNETLDIVLTEKRLLCAKNNINFSCIVDGKSLDFMSDADICSLFGNALDNAIEAVSKIEDCEKRSIGLIVRTVRGFLSVSVQNSYEGELAQGAGGLKTSKGDTINHGYGIKSMKLIAERYDGELSVAMEDGIFRLNIIFPLTYVA